MLGVIDEDLGGRVSACRQRLHRVDRDAMVVTAEMGDRRAARRLLRKQLGHHAAIISRGAGQIGAQLRHPPGHRPAVAIADDEHRPLALERVDAGLRIRHRQVERVDAAREFHRAGQPLPAIIRLETRMLAIEQRGGQHLIPFGRIVVRQIADMIGDAENLLNEDKATQPRTLRFGMIDRDFGAIAHRHAFHFSGHRALPSSALANVLNRYLASQQCRC